MHVKSYSFRKHATTEIDSTADLLHRQPYYSLHNNSFPGTLHRICNVINPHTRTFHTPMIAVRVCCQCHSVDTDPLPELNVLSHRMSLHLTLHLDVKYLQSLPSQK